jgi:glycosyltransferase involved in cell wall biosynthesis
VAIAGDPVAFAAAATALLLDADRRRAMGSRALEVFFERLSWDVVARVVAAGSVIGEAGPARTPVAP